MTNVSKKALPSAEYKLLQRQLADVFAAVNQATAEPLISELFTESEQIMFVKRVAIIALLHKGVSQYKISQSVKVSESTVSRIAAQYELGKYDSLCTFLVSQKFNSQEFWKTLETILQAGMPPMGRGRWKGIL